MADKLSDIGEIARRDMISFNNYKKEVDEYNSTHPNAEANGDAKGREPIDGTDNAGTKIDQNKRRELLTRNTFDKQNIYRRPDTSGSGAIDIATVPPTRPNC